MLEWDSDILEWDSHDEIHYLMNICLLKHARKRCLQDMIWLLDS